MIARAARTILALLSLGFLLLAVWNICHLVTGTGGKLLVEETHSIVTKRLTETVFEEVDHARLEQELQSQLNESPRNWVIIESLKRIAERREIEISEDLSEALEQAFGDDHSMLRSLRECSLCVWDRSTCETSTAMVCGIAIDLTPLGDIASLGRAGTRYWNGEDIDELDVAFSVIGLSATVLSVSTAGTSLSIKAGAGFLKFAHRANKIPPQIARVLMHAARNGIDWAGLRKVRRLDDLKTVLRMHALRPAIEVASSIGNIVNQTGMPQGMHLLKISTNTDDLRMISKASDAWHRQTAGYLAILGKQRVTRLTMRYADEVYGLVIGIFGALSSLFGALLSGAGNVIVRRLRRLARQQVPR
ncbi:hypothetical protein [Pseudodonghicola flavimaris]|uniref:Uncharacterized protein n=1 Tax=Pseudodonghicola flavimaris TaxID=3050036 RepID=A0ABT7F5W9_9RHOB|nr:hypothetical protein [Pseudodonghicola flavimaris]MDK3019799.1 hypothetical protein [Pseudodonghicola flavimaris]